MTTMDWVETGLLWVVLLVWLILLYKSVSMYKQFRDVDLKTLTNIRKMIAFMYISAHEEVASLSSQEIHYVVKWVLIKSEERRLDHNELVEFTDEMLKIYLAEKETREGKQTKSKPSAKQKKKQVQVVQPKQQGPSLDQPVAKFEIDLD